MQYEAKSGKETVAVTVEADADHPHRYRGRIGDGAERVLDLRQVEPDVYSLLVDGASYEAFVRQVQGKYFIHLRAHTFEIALMDARLKGLVDVEGAPGMEGEAVVESPMPGRVIALKAAVGNAVEEGQGIVIIEAMKMENELASPKTGKIKEICVNEGDAVEAGQKLVVIE